MDNTLARYERAHKANPGDVDLHLRYLEWKARCGVATPRDNRESMILRGEAPSFVDLLRRCRRVDIGQHWATSFNFWFQHEESAKPTLLRPYCVVATRRVALDDVLEQGVVKFWYVSGPLDAYDPEPAVQLYGRFSPRAAPTAGYSSYDFVKDDKLRQFMHLMWLHHGGPHPRRG